MASGVAIAILTWLVIIGGIESIGRVAERLTPLKVGLFLAGALVVIVSFASRIPAVLGLVFREAFTMQSALGFGMFTAMRYGLARGCTRTRRAMAPRRWPTGRRGATRRCNRG